MGQFKIIYEGIRTYNLKDAGYSSFDDAARDIKKVLGLAAALVQLCIVAQDNIKTRLANYETHSVYDDINQGKAQRKMHDLDTKIKKWSEKISYINSRNFSEYDILKPLIKELEVEIKQVKKLKAIYV